MSKGKSLDERLGFVSPPRSKSLVPRTDRNHKITNSKGRGDGKSLIENSVEVYYDKYIDEGSYGTVYQGRNKITGELYAVKVINKNNISKSDLAMITHESAITVSLDNPNIIKTHFILENEDMIQIFMDFIPGGSLHNLINEHDNFSECRSYLFFVQMVNAIHYLHSMNIVHMDIKPENMLIDNPIKQHLYLIDFGFSFVRHPQDPLSSKFAGSPAYAAPELMRAQLHTGFKADIWSLGATLYTMITGDHLPFKEGRTNRSELDLIIEKIRAKSPDLAHLLTNMLQDNEEARYNIEQVRQSPWMKRWSQYITTHGGCGMVEDSKRVVKSLRQNMLSGEGRETSSLGIGHSTGDRSFTREFMDTIMNSPYAMGFVGMLNGMSSPRSREEKKEASDRYPMQDQMIDLEDWYGKQKKEVPEPGNWGSSIGHTVDFDDEMYDSDDWGSTKGHAVGFGIKQKKEVPEPGNWGSSIGHTADFDDEMYDSDDWGSTKGQAVGFGIKQKKEVPEPGNWGSSVDRTVDFDDDEMYDSDDWGSTKGQAVGFGGASGVEDRVDGLEERYERQVEGRSTMKKSPSIATTKKSVSFMSPNAYGFDTTSTLGKDYLRTFETSTNMGGVDSSSSRLEANRNQIYNRSRNTYYPSQTMLNTIEEMASLKK